MKMQKMKVSKKVAFQDLMRLGLYQKYEEIFCGQ